MHLTIYGLPANVTEEAVRQLVGDTVPVYSVSLTPERDATIAVLTLATSHERASELSSRLSGRMMEGHRLVAWAPVMPWADPWPSTPKPPPDQKR